MVKEWSKPWLLSPLLLAVGSVAYADSLEFQTLYRSPYYQGRGDTGVANTDNHEAIFYNPAGLAQGKGIYKETVLVSPSVAMSTQTKNLATQAAKSDDITTDSLKSYAGKNLHLGLSNFTGVVFRRMALGGLVSANTNVILAKNPDQNGLETLHAEAAANRVATFSFAEGFLSDSLYLGATAKYILRQEARLDISAADAENVSEQLESEDIRDERRGYGFDIGALYRAKSLPLNLGLHVENLGSTLMKGVESGVASKRLAQIVTLGLSLEKATKFSSMTFLMDFRDALGAVETNTFKRLHLGGEVRFANLMGVTGGLNQGYPTVGMFLNLYVIRFDIGLMTQEVGTSAGVRPDQRIVGRLKIGF